MLPMLEWCDIPAGNVTISYSFIQSVVDNVGQYLEYQRSFWVESFRIAKYPVTIAQYRLFVEAQNGFSNPEWWDYSPYAREWRVQQSLSPNPYFHADNDPHNASSWYDVMAFCRWLSKETQLPILLPTEQQWQRAGQGDDGRIYPWGNDFGTGRCNCNDENGRATPVTRYSAYASPYGVIDMVGNVHEWCLTDYRTGSNDDLLTDAMRAYRGGWFKLNSLGVRLDERGGAIPDFESGTVGFRIVSNS